MQLANTLEIMIEEMVSTVCKSRLLPPSEVKSWYWRNLLRTYRQVGKGLWDDWVSDVHASEIAVTRAIAKTIGGQKNIDPLPEYSAIANDPWNEQKPKKVLSDRMRLYYVNNNIPIPPEYQ